MPTSKSRLNVTLPDDIDKSLTMLSSVKKMSKSMVALEMISRAMADYEDMYFSAVAKERLSKPGKVISDEAFWEAAEAELTK